MRKSLLIVSLVALALGAYAAAEPAGVSVGGFLSYWDADDADERGRILDAAYACLTTPHTGPVPIAAILDRAGVSTRAFYRHFASKDALFIAMLEHESDVLVARLERIPDTVHGGAVAQLHAWVAYMFELANDPRVIEAYLGSSGKHQEMLST